jgi:hypothetical protein
MSTTITGISAIALAVVLVAGCAPLPMADAGSAAQAKTFTPSPDRANVYVYRNQYLGAAVRMAITADGKEIGITRGKTYLLLPLEPGQHTIVSQGQASLPLKLVVAAGKNYFVRQEVTHNFFSFTYHSRLKLVDEATGRQGIDECELVAAAQ